MFLLFLKLIILIMFLLYYVVNLINYLVYINLEYLNKIYLNLNKFNLIFKKSFNKITFFEKFILILFNNGNWFFKSISSFSNYNNNINILKRSSFPTLNFLSIYDFNVNFKLKKLRSLKKLYVFFKKYNFFKDLNFFNFLIIQFIFNKKYFNLLNKNFFNIFENNNLIKLNYLFYFFLKKSNKNKNIKFNLNYYNDWFNFLFNNYNLKLNKTKISSVNSFKKLKLKYMVFIFKKYKKIYKLKKNNFYINLMNHQENTFKKVKSNFFKKIVFKLNINNVINILPIRFFNSSMNKYINSYNSENYSFLYLRKNKIFNKGRYSRNRQLYRTGVYWCLWLNIIIVYGLYFFFYRFTFNFGYIWFGLFIIIFSTIFSRIIKYKYYNIYYLINELFNLFNWFGLLLLNIINTFKSYLKKVEKKDFLNLIIFNKNNSMFYNFYKYKLILKKILNKKKDYGYVYVWKNYSVLDKSLFKYKSILNWFFQLYKVILY